MHLTTMRCRTKWTEAVTITWHSQERYCRYGTLHFVDLLWSYNRVLHYTPQIPTGSHPVSIMHKTSEMSECCRESPRLPLTSIFRRFSVYGWRTDRCWAWKAQVSVLVVCTYLPLHTMTPIVDASRSVMQTINLMKNEEIPQALGLCELFFLHL